MSRQKRDKSTATTTSDRNHPEKPLVQLTEEQLEASALETLTFHRVISRNDYTHKTARVF